MTVVLFTSLEETALSFNYKILFSNIGNSVIIILSSQALDLDVLSTFLRGMFFLVPCSDIFNI